MSFSQQIIYHEGKIAEPLLSSLKPIYPGFLLDLSSSGSSGEIPHFYVLQRLKNTEHFF